MLPELSGLEVLRRIRKTSDVPVILLTARGETYDKVNGLNAGADDYLPKPFDAQNQRHIDQAFGWVLPVWA